jgi:hypothetical protein
MNDAIEGILMFIGILILSVMLMGYPLMLLWNWLMPTLFNLPLIGFWQAVGLNLLSTILFKSTQSKSKEN